MAGAVSAGAYSAGVLDFLIEALDEWEKARDQPDVPKHRVIIHAMTGASAGAITAGIATVALADGLTPTGGNGSAYRVLPKLYDAWVVRPRMVGKGGGYGLLSQADLDIQGEHPVFSEKGADVTSVLDTTVLNNIRKNALESRSLAAPPKKYIAEKFHVYFSVASLRGIPYRIAFQGYGDPGHCMMLHADRIHYQIEGLGAATLTPCWADNDAKIVLHRSSYHGQPAAQPANDPWACFAESALASGAFPLGLSARVLKTPIENYQQRRWPGVPVRATLNPDWPAAWDGTPANVYSAVNVDGGLMNNEPFEFARHAIMDEPVNPDELPRNPRDQMAADRAVIMIDPFPEGPEFDAYDALDNSLLAVALRLFGALKNQARFKPSELVLAANPQIFSRYLIAPRRHAVGGVFEGADAIACGLFNGFGGFLSERFREHDYQLGRYNCQRFLQEHFAFEGNHPMFRRCPGSWTTQPWAKKYQTPSSLDEGLTGPAAEYQAIPLVGRAATPISPPDDWPSLSQAEIDEVIEKAMARTKAVFRGADKKFLAGALVSIIEKLLAGPLASAGWWWIQGRLESFLRWSLVSDLARRGQITGWSTDRNERAVLAVLAGAKAQVYTPQAIVEGAKLDAGDVTTAIGTLENRPSTAPDRVVAVTVGSDKGWALAVRQPSALQRAPVVGRVWRLFSPVHIA